MLLIGSGSHWIMCKFTPSWLEKSIAVKELTPIFKLLANSKILLLVDNYSVVYILRSKTSKDPILMNMVRKMVVLSMLHNIQFGMVHITGKHNVISDLLPHFQVNKAKSLAPWLEGQATNIPKNFFPWSTRMLT